MRNVSEQFIQLADRLLDVADLGLALDYEGFLEVDVVLGGEAELLLLLLLGLLRACGGAGVGFGVEGRACGGCGRALFLYGGALEDLEFG